MFCLYTEYKARARTYLPYLVQGLKAEENSEPGFVLGKLYSDSEAVNCVSCLFRQYIKRLYWELRAAAICGDQQ